MIRQLFKDKVFLIGLVVMVLGSGPLLLTMLAALLGLTSDPNPNPVFFGMMAMITFWPGLILIGLGIYRTRRESIE